MPSKSKLSYYALDIFFLFLGMWWLTIQARGLTTGAENYHFNTAYAIMTALGGVIAIRNAKEWGGIKSLYGRTLIGVGLALISFAIGGIIWAYYNYGGLTLSNVLAPQPISDVPYPGWPDIGFGGFFPFCLFGLWSLVTAVGFKYVWQTNRGKLFLIVTPVVATVVTFLIFKDLRPLSFDGGEALAVGLNYYYTVGDAIMIGISIALLFLSNKFGGGKLRPAVTFITLGLIVQYLADLIFNYRTSQETYYNADISDMLYATALYLIAVGGSMFTLRGKR